ncbi:hypothetical protein MOO46_02645 [Apilactobacillus apisilvae]|uniref:Uncharacterized protein n=1 Tax=Apilactobacillus apisilvae TaxID=2923364 RepID=A0ABY4PI53_9LACO|nr:SPJ_0845 family protein [Apilactobacillus apisilvae]UQS85503.1 hypothetical protein MOO46_02645 [Apilactobacillus apisilvae]
MSLNIQRNNDLNAMFDKLAKVDSNDKKRDKFLKNGNKDSKSKKKEK